MTVETFYTAEVKKIFKTMQPPLHGFYVDMVEYEDYLALRVYKPNIEEFSEPQKVQLAEYLYRLRDAIRTTGIKCHIEGVYSDPPKRRPNQRVRLSNG